MSRLLRKGLDTLGKALRETGQALDRAGLEALGKDQHKELCEYSIASVDRSVDWVVEKRADGMGGVVGGLD